MSFQMKLAQIEEMRRIVKLVDLNMELSELLWSHIEFLMRESNRLGIDFPDLDRTIDLMTKEKNLVDIISGLRSSPEVKHTRKYPEDETQPRAGFCSGWRLFSTAFGWRFCVINSVKAIFLPV